MPSRIPLILPPDGFDIKNKVGTIKPKTPEFKAVEQALGVYMKVNSRQHLLDLIDAVAAWKRSKGGNGAWTDSERNTSVRILSQWLLHEGEAIGIFPASREGWNATHNCYAYAMRCLKTQGAGNNSRPGKYAGTAKNLLDEFAEGITIDAQKDGKAVEILDNGIDNMPGRFADGHYLVAMVANNYGYHFLRRNEHLMLWTHKNGQNEVETYYYDTTLEKPLALTDEVVKKLLHQPALIGCSMNFKCYIKVPNGGIQVAG